MHVTVQFFSHLRSSLGCAQLFETLPDGSTVGQLHEQLSARFPILREMRRSILVAVGEEYQPRDHQPAEGDIVSFLPPLQDG